MLQSAVSLGVIKLGKRSNAREMEKKNISSLLYPHHLHQFIALCGVIGWLIGWLADLIVCWFFPYRKLKHPYFYGFY